MDTAQKMKFSIKDFFSKCDQISRKLWIWSHLLKKSLIENFIFCAVVIDTCPQGLHTDARLFVDDTSLFSVVHHNDESASFPIQSE